jgi:glycosyltransferase involved in cell wall biosynthesis
VRKFRFPADRTTSIPNAIDLDPFINAARDPRPDGTLRLLSLGRIIDSDKGVFWLPKIMDRLADQPVTLTVAGDGPDLAQLKKQFAHMNERVRFIGRVSPVDAPGLFAEHDVFISTSRFEGLPLTLVEAMAAGCVPVASRIKGVTDYVIQGGENGHLFGIGDVKAAARQIRLLAQDREMLTRMSLTARHNNIDRFGLDSMSRGYAEAIHQVMTRPAALIPPLSFAHWKYPAGLKPGLRTYLPKGLKNRLRAWRERFAT